MSQVPTPIRLLALVLCALVLMSALAGAVLALASGLSPTGHVSWFLLGFEFVVVIAAALGVAFGRGRFSESPALTLACIAGTVLVASAIGWQGAGRAHMGASLTPWLLMRAAIAGALAASGAACVLRRDHRSWRLAATGAALGLPAVLIGAALASDRARRPIDAAMALFGDAAALRFLAAVAAALVIGSLFAAGAHCIIRAFELGADNPAGGSTSPRA